jgi:fructokinase
MSPGLPLLAGVELGGTKCICCIGTGPHDLRDQWSVPTGREPGEVLPRIIARLHAWQAIHGPIAALGIASFGPLDLDRRSARYGHITSTAKPGWQYTDVAGPLIAAFSVPTAFDTDVNGAALAEGRWGAARDLADFAYVTVGTGVGVGLVSNGRLIHGFGHPELGHLRIAHAPGDDWPGACARHGNCVEGLASGTAIAARAGRPAAEIPADSPVWWPVAHALAQLLQALVLGTAPRRIMLGGGVMQARPGLLPQVRVQLLDSLAGYIDLERQAGPLEQYVVAPGLGPLAGPLGALALAADARHGAADAPAAR